MDVMLNLRVLKVNKEIFGLINDFINLIYVNQIILKRLVKNML